MGTKSCRKILNFRQDFRAKILPSKISKRSLWGKNLVDGKCFVGHGFDELVYALLCGEDTKFKLPKAGNGNVFFLEERVRFARADKAVAL